MSRPNRYETWYGRDESPIRVRTFSVGPISFDLVGVDLKSVRYGTAELVDRVYMSVRDQNWDTIAPAVSALKVQRTKDGALAVTFLARNRSGLIDLAWRGAITATVEGTITYEMAGTAQSSFCYCRIGFCHLHSETAAAGRRYRATTPDGIVEGRLPGLVGPQLVVDGRELPLFPACSALTIEADGLESDAVFEGSLFVMEDQRNWTDASFKTCCEAGGSYPYPAEPGQLFSQRVTISASGPAPLTERRRARIAVVEIGERAHGAWPALGLGSSSEINRPLDAREARRLAALKLDHLRVDVHTGFGAWETSVLRAMGDAQATGTELEVALFGDERRLDAIDRLAAMLGEGGARVGRLLVFDEATAANHVTPADWVQTVVTRLARMIGTIPVHGGTHGDFAELNRERPAYNAPFGLVYAMNPQVHAFDEASLAETLGSQATTVRTAREFARGGPVAISPVTLRQRFNPSATEAPVTPDPNVLPAAVDPRQMSLFAAGWTLGSIGSLAGAGVGAITYFETVGWRGVMEADGSGRRRGFPSRPGQVFPVYHVFADLAGRDAAARLDVESSDARAIATVAMRKASGVRLLVANLTPRVQEVAAGPLPGRGAWMRRLDDSSYTMGTSAPARFRAQAERLRLRGGTARFTLPPFAYLRLDAGRG